MPSDAFPTTRWSLVLDAGAGQHEALQALFSNYWLPLYAYARRRTRSEQDAQDAVQGLVTTLLSRDDLAKAAPERGKFRSFLLTAMKHHLANRGRAERAAKRGGGTTTLSLDWMVAERRYRELPSDAATPEDAYHRHWALLTVDRAMETLRLQYEGRGQLPLFDALHASLLAPTQDYSVMAAQLEMNKGAVRVAVHRLRKRFHGCVRRIVAETVCDPREVEAELRDLLDALS